MIQSMEGKSTPLTQTELKELLKYDPATGQFTWLNPKSRRLKKGDVAGNDSAGAIQITINSKPYRANRLAWLYMTGEWPAYDVKYINGMVNDNRWSNLTMGTRKRT